MKFKLPDRQQRSTSDMVAGSFRPPERQQESFMLSHRQQESSMLSDRQQPFFRLSQRVIQVPNRQQESNLGTQTGSRSQIQAPRQAAVVKFRLPGRQQESSMLSDRQQPFSGSHRESFRSQTDSRSQI